MLGRKILTVVEKYLESPFASVFAAITVITTSWGVISVYRDLIPWLGSKLAAFMIAALLALLALFVLTSFLLPNTRRRYSLPFGERYILTKVDRRWDIDNFGNSSLTNFRTYVFFAKPNEADLSDTVFGSSDIDLNNLEYESEDSTAIDSEQINENMRRIFWQPKNGDVEIGVPYIHHVNTKIPHLGKELPQHAIMVLVAPVFTVSFSLSMSSRMPIHHVVVYKGSRFQKFKDEDEIARRGETIRRRGAPLPSILDKHNFSWSVENVPAGTTYYAVAYLKY